jgi:L-alanine-DL-glutamate epimerase-like enolase superfamily enzyme
MTTHELRITRASAIRYQMPLKRPYGTARGVTKASINFLVQLAATTGTEVIQGVGECQPRHALTGDGGKDRVAAWAFACAAARHLQGRTVRFSDQPDAIGAVREIMRELSGLAQQHADATNQDRPFRGTLLGAEVALLDVVSRVLRLEIAELLGKKREEVRISISTISSSTDMDDVARRVIKQARFPMTRVKGTGDLAHDLELLDLVNRANRSVRREKSLWIDINEALDLDAAARLVRELVQRMAAGALPASLLLEGALPKSSQTRELPWLQRLADEQCHAAATNQPLDLRIMPDEGLWDADDLAELNSFGGCRAINIKAPKAGGLLASLDLATAAVANDPDVHICIGGMVGTSDITAWALHNLARAMPRLDYSTTVPPQNVCERIADPLARYVQRGSNLIAAQTSPGLGTRLLLDKVAPYVQATFDAPTASIPAEAGAERRSGSTDSTRTLVFAGDTSLGDVYIRRAGGQLLDRLDRDPMSFFEGLRPVVSDQDALVLNLETVLADSPRSPFEGRKSYLGWDSPVRTIDCLRKLGVDAVSLANNHTMDYGSTCLLSTRSLLHEAGIAAFGAGESRTAAATPLTLDLDFDGIERRVHIIGTMQLQAKLRDEFGFYAGDDRPGVNAMSVPGISVLIHDLRRTDPTSFIVVFPHWGRNYQWASKSMQRAADAFAEAGANLVIGHGAHMLQQCSFSDRHAVAYSLGNFLFNWGGRFQKVGAPPFGLVAHVELKPAGDAWDVGLRLYPILINNRLTNHQPAPVDSSAFELVWSTLCHTDLDHSFNGRARADRDSLGHHIAYSFVTASAQTQSR